MVNRTKLILWLPMLVVLIGGQARAEIVWGAPRGITVSETAPEQDQFAAKEFQRLYKLRTGRELQIYTHDVYKGVYIGRTTLKENPPAPPTNENQVGLRLGRGEDDEHYIQKCLQFNFDDLDAGGFAYMAKGWTTFEWALLIAGKTPDDTVQAVYCFCEDHLGLKRLKSGEFVVSDEPLKDWGPVKYVSGRPSKEDSDSALKEKAKPAVEPDPSQSSESHIPSSSAQS